MQELFPDSEIIGDILFIPTEYGMISANVGDTIIVTDTVILAIDKIRFDELFEVYQPYTVTETFRTKF